MNEGWLCPRCGIINAPHVNHCECTPNMIPLYEGQNIPETSKISECLQGNHLWECTGLSTVGMRYNCSRCGAIKTEPFTNNK